MATMDSSADRYTVGRAKTLEELGVKLGLMGSAEALQRGLSLELRATDIVVTPFSKSGTTWLQQMCHTLRTRGDMDFEDISAVAPWIETSTYLGLDLDAPQKANPRIFKSHLDAHRIPKGGRYLCSCRDPKDAIYSMYKFMEGWFLEPGSITLDEFALGTFVAAGKKSGSTGGDYWTHLKSWWDRREDTNVLFMAFEHMRKDLQGTIRKVAAFMNIDLDDELLAITMEHASLSFMQQHGGHFDDKLMRDRSVAVAGIPADSDSAKVRVGQVGQAKQHLSESVVEELDAIWRKEITRELGFEDYAAMISALH